MHLENQIQNSEAEKETPERKDDFGKAAYLHKELLGLHSKLVGLTESKSKQEIVEVTKDSADAKERKRSFIQAEQHKPAGTVHKVFFANGG